MGRGVWISHTDTIALEQDVSTRARPSVQLGRQALAIGGCVCFLLVLATLAFARWFYYDLRIAHTPMFSVRPLSSDQLNNLGVTEYERGQSNTALAYFEQGLTLNPSDYMLLYNRGLSFQELGLHDLALADFTNAAGFGYIPAQIARGFSLYWQGEYQQSISEFDKVLSNWYYSKHADPYRGRGLALYMLKEYDKALADFELAVNYNSLDPWNFNSRGIAYMAKKHYAQAQADFEEALKLDPQMATAHFNLGLVRLYTGEKDKSLADFKKAYELADDDKLRSDAEAQLRNFGIIPGRGDTDTP